MGETAEEHYKRKMQDPKYREMLEQKNKEYEEAVAKAQAIGKPILEDLASVGFKLDDIDDLLKISEPLSNDVVDVLSKWIKRLKEENFKETLIRGFTGQRLEIDYKLLTDIYDDPNASENMQWVIANCIAESKIDGIEDWLKERVVESQHIVLSLAAARYLAPSFVMPLLIKRFDEKDDVVYDALGEIGTEKELQFMESNVKRYKGHSKRRIERAIKKIKKRLNP